MNMLWGKANLNGTGIDNSLLSIQTLSDSVLGNDCLSSTGMRGHQDTLVPLYSVHGHLLERIQLKLVLPVRFCGWDVLRYWRIIVSRWHCNLVTDLNKCHGSEKYSVVEHT